MKIKRAKNFSEIERYISDENQEERFEDAINAISFALENKKTLANLIVFYIEGEENEFVFDVEISEWKNVLNNTLSFFEECENYEKCAIVKQILKKHEHSEKKF